MHGRIVGQFVGAAFRDRHYSKPLDEFQYSTKD